MPSARRGALESSPAPIDRRRQPGANTRDRCPDKLGLPGVFFGFKTKQESQKVPVSDMMNVMFNTISANRRALWPIGTIVLAGLLLSYPLLVWGFPPAPDMAEHIPWFRSFSAQFHSGEWYPRWLRHTNSGLGSPSLFVYAPLPYWLASLFESVLPAMNVANRDIRLLGLFSALLLIVSGLSSYLWVSGFASRRGAVVAAIVYMLLPTTLMDFYYFGNLPTHTAYALMPVALYFAHRIIKGQSWGLPGFSLAVAALALTHLWTTAIFFVVPPAWALFTAKSNIRLSAFFKICIGYGTGFCISAIYLLPFSSHEHTDLSWSRLVSARASYSFERWFLFDSRATVISSLGIVGALCIVAVACASARWFRPGTRTDLRFWLLIVACSVFMMTRLSWPLWHTFPLLQQMIFPVCRPVLLSLAATALCGIGTSAFEKIAPVHYRRILWASVALGVIFLVPVIRLSWTWQDRLNAMLPDLNGDYDAFTQLWVSAAVPGLMTGPEVARLAMDQPLITIPNGGRAKILSWQPRRIELVSESAVPAQITLRQFYYRDWNATLQPGSRQLQVQPSTPAGLIQVEVPSGTNTVLLVLQPRSAETTGTITSFVALCFCAVLVLLELRSTSIRSSAEFRRHSVLAEKP